MDLLKLRAQLVLHEGIRLKGYRDTVGKFTIGVGRNLDDRGITEREAFFMLDTDIALVIDQLTEHLPWFASLSDVRQRVLADMAFNLGIKGLMGFTNTLAAIEHGAYATAAAMMLKSKWAGQVGSRATRLAAMMRTGIDK